MLTELQRLKTDHMFRVYDVDRDGIISSQDYVAYVHRLAKLQGWWAGHPAYLRFLGMVAEHWRRMRVDGDTDRDYTISLGEYRAHIERWIAAGATTIDEVADTWFGAFDDDQDGKVTVEEYAVVLRAYGLDSVDAGAYFAHFDLDGDGYLTREEVRILNRQYWLSEELADPGHYILGPVEGLPGIQSLRVSA